MYVGHKLIGTYDEYSKLRWIWNSEVGKKAPPLSRLPMKLNSYLFASSKRKQVSPMDQHAAFFHCYCCYVLLQTRLNR